MKILLSVFIFSGLLADTIKYTYKEEIKIKDNVTFKKTDDKFVYYITSSKSVSKIPIKSVIEITSDNGEIIELPTYVETKFVPLYTLTVEDSLYLSKRKDPFTAGFISSLLFPTGLGHLYAGKWYRSTPYIIGMYLGYLLVSKNIRVKLNIYNQNNQNNHINPNDAAQNNKVFQGLLLLEISYWGNIFDAAKTTSKYNMELYNQIYITDFKKLSMFKIVEKELIKKYHTNNITRREHIKP